MEALTLKIPMARRRTTRKKTAAIPGFGTISALEQSPRDEPNSDQEKEVLAHVFPFLLEELKDKGSHD
jgi:hypothetical protein